MSQTAKYVERLMALKEGKRSRLRCLAGRPLDASLQGFDLFTGLWWPLRAESQAAPRREPAWLVAKLYSSFRIPHLRPDSGIESTLAAVLGRCEPKDQRTQQRFRSRFDALLGSPLSALEPHLRWALSEVAKAVNARVPHVRDVGGIDWVQLLDDLSIWDQGEEHRRRRDVRDIWAEAYLDSAKSKETRAERC